MARPAVNQPAGKATQPRPDRPGSGRCSNGRAQRRPTGSRTPHSRFSAAVEPRAPHRQQHQLVRLDHRGDRRTRDRRHRRNRSRNAATSLESSPEAPPSLAGMNTSNRKGQGDGKEALTASHPDGAGVRHRGDRSRGGIDAGHAFLVHDASPPLVRHLRERPSLTARRSSATRATARTSWAATSSASSRPTMEDQPRSRAAGRAEQTSPAVIDELAGRSRSRLPTKVCSRSFRSPVVRP